MGDALTKIFGGADKSGIKAQKKFNNKLLDQIAEQAAGGRADMLGLWPSSMQSRAGGTQSALDVLGGVIPQQLSAYQQGNVGAQQQLINGMNQYQNAIMGLPVNYGSFQPQQISYDPSFAQQTLPNMGGGGFDLSGYLGGSVPSGAAGGLGGGGQQGTGGAVNKAGDPSMGFQTGENIQNWLNMTNQQINNRNESPSAGQYAALGGNPDAQGWGGIDWAGVGVNMASRLPGMSDSLLRQIFGDEAVDSIGSTREDNGRGGSSLPGYQPGFGYASYDPYGSITGGGAYRYPTRLMPRPTGLIG